MLSFYIWICMGGGGLLLKTPFKKEAFVVGVNRWERRDLGKERGNSTPGWQLTITLSP